MAERWSSVRRAFAVARVGRFDLDNRGEDLEARVKPGWFWVSVAWLCFILTFWSFIGALVFVPALIARELPRGVLIWGPFWAFSGLWICYVSRDHLVRETLVFAGGTLTLKRNYLVVTLTESFRAEEVRDLRAAGMGNGTVEFEAGEGRAGCARGWGVGTPEGWSRSSAGTLTVETFARPFVRARTEVPRTT